MKYKWIEKFQRISWEPEILISGGILFATLQVDKILFLLDNYLLSLPFSLQPVLGVLGLAISALTIGFSLHLISKAFWIAMLGLKSVYPQGINPEKLKYSTSYIKADSSYLSLESALDKTGKTSSLLFVVL